MAMYKIHFKRLNTCLNCKHMTNMSKCKKVRAFEYKIRMYTTCDLFEGKK